MRFLIAGSSGFLGTRLREQLQPAATTSPPWYAARPRPARSSGTPTPPLDPAVVDRHDVVVNLAGSPTLGNPHSKRWADELLRSRVTTTRVLAEAIAASEQPPTSSPATASRATATAATTPLNESDRARGDAFMTRVTRQWQAATEPARPPGPGSACCALLP